MRTTTKTLAGLVLATGLGLAGCGSEDVPADPEVEIPPVQVPETISPDTLDGENGGGEDGGGG
ncbi:MULTISPECIES: hypothetical protein [unclassified Modestobacter]